MTTTTLASTKPSSPLTPAAVTNDIFTREDQEFLIRNEALPKERIRAIETGGCPHAAIREDISANLHALEELQAEFDTELLFVESGGDNLAANYSRELADYIIYVVGLGHLHKADTRSTSLEETRCLVRAGLVSPSLTCLLSTRWVLERQNTEERPILLRMLVRALTSCAVMLRLCASTDRRCSLA